MAEEVLHWLAPRAGQLFIDGTIGGGGHARTLLDATAPDGRLLGIDCSVSAIDRLSKQMKEYGNRLTLACGNFRDLKTIAKTNDFESINGILLDLGFSSDELLDPTLGLSFQTNGPLDMRLGGDGATAADIVNGSTEDELVEIIRDFGEERFARPIAHAIVKERRRSRFETTFDLVRVVTDAVPRGYERGRINPATRTFQALRIAVNEELSSLANVLPQAVDLLASGGRLAVISFHSLEDRIVKRFLREHDGTDVRVLTKRPILADEEEVRKNSRSRSAKLRVAERI